MPHAAMHMHGHAMACAGALTSGKVLDRLDRRVHDSTNLVKGLQSSVSKLENIVKRNNGDVASALKCQASLERAVQGIQVPRHSVL